MAIYRKLYPRLWTHPRFLELYPLQRLLTLEILTGQANRIGLFRWSPLMAGEHCGCSTEDVLEALPGVLEAWGWSWDPEARVMWVRSWLNWNPPPNWKAMKGWFRDLEEIPNTMLIDQFREYLESKVRTSKGYQIDTNPIRYRLGMSLRPYQDQEQEQEQEQKKEEVEVSGSALLLSSSPKLAPNGVADPTTTSTDAQSANGNGPDPGTGALIRGLWIEAHTQAGRQPPRYVSTKDDAAAGRIQATLLGQYTAPEVREGFAQIARTYLRESKARTPTLAKMEPDLEHWWARTEEGRP